MSDASSLIPYLVSGGAITVTAIIWAVFRRSSLDAIPTVGSATRLGSYWTAFKHKNNTAARVQEGYEKYKDSLFKVPMLHYWIIVVVGPKFREDVRRASDDQLSGVNAAEDFFKLRYLIGSSLPEDPFSTSVIRTRLNRNLVALIPIIRDEITAACDDVLALKHDEWRTVLASDISQTLISRITSRIIIGLPLCRDPEWLNIAIRVGTGITISGAKLDLFPPFLRPLAARFLFESASLVKQAVPLVEPVITERRRIPVDDPAYNALDILQWLMDDGDQQSAVMITQRLLVIIFASVNVVTHTFTEALLYLVAKPEYLEELREEVDTLVYAHGWTKTALDKMWKVDSFLKETHRLSTAASVTMLRKVVKGFAFTDGTVVPKGCYIVSPSLGIHSDEENYESPSTFDPFRFHRLREKLGESAGYQMITPNPEFIAFGLGKHACPGRFLTAKIQKMLLAHIVSSYDVKPGNNATPQKCAQVGIFSSPDSTSKILFKARTN